MGPTPTRHYFKNVAPPSGFWPLLLAFGPPAAKSWRRVCRDENWNSRDQDRDSQKWVSRRVSLVIDVLTGHCRLVICVIDGHWCLESNSYSCFFFNSWKLILSTRKNLTKFVLEEAIVCSLSFWLRYCYLAKMIAYFSFIKVRLWPFQYCCIRQCTKKFQRWSDSGFLLSDPILFLKNDNRNLSESCFS